MPVRLEQRKVATQCARQCGEMRTRVPKVEVVRHEIRLHWQRWKIRGQEIRVTLGAHGCLEVSGEGGLGGRMSPIESKQLDVLAGLRPHVDEQLRRLTGD